MFYDHLTIIYNYDFYRYRTGWPPPASSPLLYSTNYCSDMQLLAWPSSLPLSPPFCPAYCACALTFFFLCFGSLPRRRSLKGAVVTAGTASCLGGCLPFLVSPDTLRRYGVPGDIRLLGVLLLL